MQTTHVDPLMSALDQVELAIAHSLDDRERAWAASVYDALGKLVHVVQEQMEESRRLAKQLGKVNPEVRLVPTVARQAERHREQQLNLGERIYAVREDIRRVDNDWDDHGDSEAALLAVARKVRELVETIRTEQRKEATFALEAINSNPGSGE